MVYGCMRGSRLVDWVVLGLLLVGTVAGRGIVIEDEDDIIQGRELLQAAPDAEGPSQALKDLRDGVLAGDLGLVEKALDAGADVNAADVGGRTPLWGAVAYNHKEIALELLSWGADPNIEDFQGYSPWIVGVLGYTKQMRKIIVAMIDNGAEVDVQFPHVNQRATALGFAAGEGEFNLASILLESGADLEILDTNGRSPLSRAAAASETKLIELLLEYKAEVDVKDDDGYTALHLAAETGDSEGAQYLLKAGADVNAQTNDKDTPLILAISWASDIATVKALIKNGANVNLVNSNGDAPLHKASTVEDVQIIKMLLKAKANVNVQDNTDLLTPLHWAAAEGLEDNVRELVANGADSNVKSLTSLTPLHISFRKENTTSLVTILLDAGSDIEAVSDSSWTPLHYAALWGSIDGVQLLLEQGANRKAKTIMRATPPELACQCTSRSFNIPDLVGELRYLKSCWTAVCDSEEGWKSLEAVLKKKPEKDIPKTRSRSGGVLGAGISSSRQSDAPGTSTGESGNGNKRLNMVNAISIVFVTTIAFILTR